MCIIRTQNTKVMVDCSENEMSELMLLNANLGNFELCQRKSNGYIYVHLEERLDEKSLQIPNGHSKTVRRRSNNTVGKRKRTKGQTMVNKSLHEKQRLSNTSSTKMPGSTHMLLTVKQFLLQ